METKLLHDLDKLCQKYNMNMNQLLDFVESLFDYQDEEDEEDDEDCTEDVDEQDEGEVRGDDNEN